jgi:hypothetical protein
MLSKPLKFRISEDDQCLENDVSMLAIETDIINIPFRIMTDIFAQECSNVQQQLPYGYKIYDHSNDDIFPRM